MEKLRFDLTENAGKFKILNATNGGPIHKRHALNQYRSNLEIFKEARISYARKLNQFVISKNKLKSGQIFAHFFMLFLTAFYRQ